MAKRSSMEDTHEKILTGALEIFSEKGYSAATIKDISNKADCNTVTIFRHFEDKLCLFVQVVERFHKIEFHPEFLRSKLSYTNIHADFTLLARVYFEVINQNIHILRIFINDGHNFEPISKYLWHIPAPLKDFTVEYMESMYLETIATADAALLSEMFLSYIIRTCLRLHVHEKEAGKPEQDLKEVLSVSVDMMIEMIMLHVKKQPGKINAWSASR